MSGKDATYESRVMSTLYNPFSLKNLDPKWPDGLCTTSKGVQLRKTSELVGSEVIIALVPGFVNWCFAYTWNEDRDLWELMMNHCDNQHVMSVFETVKPPGTLGTEPTGALGTNMDHTNIDGPNLPDFSSWRGVSYGMRMMNVNTDHDNDGWFECVRTSRSVFLNRMGIIAIDPSNFSSVKEESFGSREKDNIYLKPGCVFPLNATAQEWYSARNWAIMPSYASGKLKDLQDFVFQLNPEKGHNDFQPIQFTPFFQYDSLTKLYVHNQGITFKYLEYDKDLYKDVFIKYDDDRYINLGMTTENQDALPDVNFEKWQNFHKGFTSENFDIILVKIHGLENTRTVISSVANLEFQTNERKSSGHHHQTNSFACLNSLDKYIDYKTNYGRSPFQDVSKNKN